jgi:ubiquitin-conjugating enzyme E2 M
MKVPQPNCGCETDVCVGMYKGGSFVFSFAISNEYPHHPPKVRCTQRVPYLPPKFPYLMSKIYHPNIDTAGNICLNVLREDWKPVLNLNAVIYGLQVSTLTRVLSGTDF